MKGFATSSEKKSWREVADITTTVNATNITIADLDLSSWGEIEIEANLLLDTNSGAGVTHTLRQYINGDTTATNYTIERLLVNNVTLTPANYNDCHFLSSVSFTTANNLWLLGRWRILGSRVSCIYDVLDRTSTADTGLEQRKGVLQANAQSNMTSYTINSFAANGLLAGSRIIVRRWYK